MEQVINEIRLILEDFSANEIEEAFKSIFENHLRLSTGMEGEDLGNQYELIKRITNVFHQCEILLKQMKE